MLKYRPKKATQKEKLKESQFNIRGLGPGSTLILINGRRAGIAPVATNLGNQFFDINQLPLAMIERIDFLTDGAD
ncbi:TonB-dependent receptor plug domain-containing protein [Aestuariibacter sp. A3R04]|uniref:TonB-dependent receptor plug domain-containing protein n=1 Tax=Aestuariibacter sp. A3R04 TaxID=2841571 RepID=UPI001C08F3C0|nr:TonB-dependent receptor plug domain-containing protein [Aestuariibacter sp. A3R04]MBU3020465.1 TonB-dependent receptor plug domain-containing protein [Aestuariibacter sp. A3R04]